MFTANNYYSKVQDINFKTFPEALQKGHEYVGKVTNSGTNWKNYHASETIKKVIDTYFEKLNDHIGKSIKRASPQQKVKRPKVSSPGIDQAREDIKTYSTLTKEGLERLLKIEQHAQKEHGSTPAITMRLRALKRELDKRKHRNAPGKKKADKYPSSMVERISEEVRLIKRFVGLNGKTKTKEDILRFINTLQKAIVEKKIRKTSEYAEQIRFIQSKLIDTFNSMGKQIRIELKQSTYEALKAVAGDEKVLSSISFIKRYIGLNGKVGMKEKARALIGQITQAYEKGKISNSDPYIVEMNELKKNLEYFISHKEVKTLEIEPNTLNGLEGILGCACNSIGELGYVPITKPTIMNSMDFAKLRFNTIGMKGKWLELIGDPTTNFTAMVFGKPKTGKSFLCVDFAGYLARNHGKVLYVAKEEGLDKTLQDKLNDKDVKHSNLFVASELPTNLYMYDFIFLDSVNKLGLTPTDLNKIKASYPEKSFIYIFQTTKSGAFRGANTFQHDVDSVIEVPERGRAVQYGRFNQGGEIKIFEDNVIAA